MVVGASAVANLAGLHHETGLKPHLNYELMKPADVGLADSQRVAPAARMQDVVTNGNGHAEAEDDPDNHVADTLRHLIFG